LGVPKAKGCRLDNLLLFFSLPLTDIFYPPASASILSKEQIVISDEQLKISLTKSLRLFLLDWERIVVYILLSTVV